MGPSIESINRLSRTLNGQVKDLAAGLPEKQLLPGGVIENSETVSADICDVETFNVSAEVDATSSSGFVCADSSEYSFTPGKICEVEVSIVCALASDSDIDCDSIPPAQNEDECIVGLEYIYSVTNVGPDEENIASLKRTLQDVEIDITSDLGIDKELQAGATAVVSEVLEVNICEGTTFVTTVKVEMELPSDGFACEDTSEYTFTTLVPTQPPTPPPTPLPTSPPTPPPTPLPTLPPTPVPTPVPTLPPTPVPTPLPTPPPTPVPTPVPTPPPTPVPTPPPTQ